MSIFCFKCLRIFYKHLAFYFFLFSRFAVIKNIDLPKRRHNFLSIYYILKTVLKHHSHASCVSERKTESFCNRKMYYVIKTCKKFWSDKGNIDKSPFCDTVGIWKYDSLFVVLAYCLIAMNHCFPLFLNSKATVNPRK